MKLLRSIRQEQLILPDDPAFSADLALLHLPLELEGLDHSDSASLLSPYQIRSSPPSVAARSFGQHGRVIAESSRRSSGSELSLPSDGGDVAGRVSGFDAANLFEDDEADRLLPDVDFEFDQDGNIRDVEMERERQQGSVALSVRARADRSSAVDGRVRREHEEGRRARLEVSDAAFVIATFN
jgi:hypothetical protein